MRRDPAIRCSVLFAITVENNVLTKCVNLPNCPRQMKLTIAPAKPGSDKNTDKMKTYIVSQTFETLGDPCRSEYTRKRDAERAANRLRRDLAEMVAGWETPNEHPTQPTGYTNEIEAWASAAETAGVEYDDAGARTANSPETYGREAGEEIAEAAVEIEIEEQ